MNPSPAPPLKNDPADADLLAQAQSGRGVPSQDPTLGAQVLLSPEEAEREARSVYVGGGVVTGMATGAAIGAVVGGPVGVVVGGSVGAVVGALGAAVVGEAVNPDSSPSNNAASDSRPPLSKQQP